ncbi:acyl-CoA desaturase [Brevibacillus sp. SYP-B805]|uniref:fatty acid desaturase family protein n=1 Tax=Brevibacillus sp. SYP-B805 TaxID=1578199 RepID=UPI0013E9BA57|nr:acyl-CoA desaturase [Brevibacillus sp. SYP-B805]NGQ96158.1 acyl-CoA desaturase [Brevibacillus sp. SYP-B805]
MKELHTFGWYAARISPHLPDQAFQPVPARLLGGLAYLIVTITGLLFIGLLDLHPIFNLMIAMVLGASFAALGFLGHEILHGTVVRKPWLRDILGAVAFWPLSTGPKLWRKWHNLTHHVHTQHEELDPDAWVSLEQFLKRPFVQRIYRLPLIIRSFVSFTALTVSFTFHSIRMFGRFVKEFRPQTQPVLWLQLLLPWATWIGLLFWIGLEKWLFAYLIPLLIANGIVMAYISTNHRLNPLVPVNDPLANSLSVTVPRWVDILHFHFSYHTEHHLFPGMSSKYYPLVKQHIKRMWPDRYHEMPLWKALIALWKTPRIYYQEKNLIDPRSRNVYGSLGHGLDPADIKYRKQC